MILKYTLFVLLLVLSAVSLYGQDELLVEEHYIDVIYLKNGSKFRGYLQDYRYGEYATFEVLGGPVLTFAAKDIRRIRQEYLKPKKNRRRSFLAEKPYEFKERGLYVTALGGFLTGTAAWSNELITGLEAELVAGYQFNRWIGAGFGMGVNNYYPAAGEVVYPVFLEGRGYLRAQNLAPYYAVATGYSFAFAHEDKNITEAKGGWMLHPAIGFRLGGSLKSNFTIDFGVKFQQATFTREIWDTDRREMTYKRFTSRLGILF